MKKSLFLLPLLAVTLCSCGGDEGRGDVIETDYSKLAPSEFLGHNRVTKLEDGKAYYFAVCKHNDDNRMMFLNGDEHSDDEGTYPYYMSETEIETEEDLVQYAAKVTVDFINDKEFTMHISKEGADNDDTYIGIYTATSSYSNDVLSFHCGSEVGEKFVDDRGVEHDTMYNWTWCDEFNSYAIQTVVMMYQDERTGDTEKQPKFIGTGGDYVSMDCKNDAKALADEYNLAYFYEV